MVRFSLVLRLVLAGVTGATVLAAPALSSPARADDGWGDDDSGGDDGWGDDDSEKKDEGGDEWSDEGWGEEEEEQQEEQPPVTAGGLYTKRTYPVAELQRPLTLIGGMFEARGGIDIDVGNQTAFDNWRGVLEGRYGLKDYLELRFGADFLLAGEATPPLTNQARFSAGFESSIVFDLVDFRAQAEVPINPDAPKETDSAAFDLAFGFPFRYRYKDKIGIVALDRLMTIHTNGDKPDLTVGAGAIGQVAEPFAVLARAEVIVPQFNFDDTITIPATVAAQFSPNNRVDLGLEFTLGNVKPPGGGSPFDARSLLLYVQPRF